MSLLDKAKAFKTRQPGRNANQYTDEHYAVAVAWFRDEITQTQAASVLGIPDAKNAYPKMASILRHGVRFGRVKVEMMQ